MDQSRPAPRVVQSQSPPPLFQPFATAAGFLSEPEMDRLIAEHVPLLAEAKLGPGNRNAEIRRSQVVFFRPKAKYDWLYDRVWAAAQECNRQFFGVDIAGVEANIQFGRYDSSDRGFYDWHTDFAGLRPDRKISISIQLSASADYDGGDLELMYDQQPHGLDRTRGPSLRSRVSRCIA